jgi:K+-sensing histidine kinase KdpD
MTPRWWPRRSFTEFLDWKMRQWVLYRSPPPKREPAREAPVDPGVDAKVAKNLRLVGYLAAVLVPVLVGTALIPLRETITNTNAALVLVVVVVLAALAGGPGPGVTAALVAAGVFDLFLTRPYYHPVIHAADDVETAVLLLVVGLLVGLLVARETQARTRAAGRGRELDHLRAVITSAARAGTPDELRRATEQQLAELLGLRRCRWAPGYHGQTDPLLARSGTVSGGTGARRDLRKLPEQGVELSVEAGGQELGRFVLQPEPDRTVSLEERATAVAIADVFGLRLLSLPESRSASERSSGSTPESANGR